MAEYVMGDLCPGSLGPTPGDVLRYDTNDHPTTWVIPRVDLDCWVTLRGSPATSQTSLTWRGAFVLVGYEQVNDSIKTFLK